MQGRQLLGRDSCKLPKGAVAGSNESASCRCTDTSWQVDFVRSHGEHSIAEGAPDRLLDGKTHAPRSGRMNVPMNARPSPSRGPDEANNLADLYGLPILDWYGIADRLAEGVTQAPGTGGPDRHTCWLATINRDGSPHLTGVGALWVDDAFWFETGEHTRKGRNLARDPRCSLSVATLEFDLVVEGNAEQVVDPGTVASMAARWNDEGWPARVDESGVALTAEFSAPSAGPPPWVVYRMVPDQATALRTVEPGGATRWTFRSI